MIRLFLISLMMVCAMPSSSAETKQRLTLEQYYDSNARYRSTRHHHGNRISHRRYNRTRLYVPSVVVLPAPSPAREDIKPLYRQDPVRWTDVDVSTVLKPMDAWVAFPPDPGKFKLPADPPSLDSLLPRVHDETPIFYIFALGLLAVLGTGMAAELRKPKTCHKGEQIVLRPPDKKPSWMPLSVWRQREALRSLT